MGGADFDAHDEGQPRCLVIVVALIVRNIPTVILVKVTRNECAARSGNAAHIARQFERVIPVFGFQLEDGTARCGCLFLALAIAAGLLFESFLRILAVKILDYVRDQGRVRTRDMVREFGASPNTVKVTFRSMVEKRLLARYRAGRSTWYGLP